MASTPADEATPLWSETDFRLVFGSTRVEYYPTKEDSNRAKHGYSLESAVHLFERWLFPVPSQLLMRTDSFLANGEIRHNHMMLDEDAHVVFFVTTMRPNESVRVISLRRASDSERVFYLGNAGAMEYPLK